ncbi:cupin domain-containing protein [Thalassolituus marinus]|uniref:Cupin domain-containing protein n=1 Tax=Thalassolituus marinus TaxID=671053 RepID=A0ABS7ZT20_9GAMM|nr:cupin domain-containing protein [Thalassolituus marinus]MCA6063560.1 cupin domain-containing protein [Thalassolituus marinus]
MSQPLSQGTPRAVILPAPASGDAEEYYLDADKLISGNPKQSLWLEYQDPSGQFFAGVWSSEVGEWRVNYNEEEYCRIISGISTMTDSEGNATTVKAGDEFVIPAGFSGVWKVVETTTKRFVIYEKAS